MGEVENIAGIAHSMRLNLTEHELSEIVATVKGTGSFAPEAEAIAQFQAGTMTPGVVTFYLPRLWRYRPDTSKVPSEVWRAMFEQAEYTEDMVVRERPKRTYRAYRGATFENRDGLSWSHDVEQAKYFARFRQAPGAPARVWVTNIPPERMHARYLDGWEQETTADVRGLDIRPIEEEHLLRRPRHWPWQR